MKIELSERAHAVVCGLVASSENVNHDGIIVHSDVWEEIRGQFGFDHFQHAVSHGIIKYDEFAGE